MPIVQSIVHQSFRSLTPLSQKLTHSFFDLLRRLYPELEAIFPWIQPKLEAPDIFPLFQFYMDHCEDGTALQAYFGQAAEQYKEIVRSEKHYLCFRTALLKALASLLSDKWTPKVAEQWGLTFDRVADFVRNAAPAPATPAPVMLATFRTAPSDSQVTRIKTSAETQARAFVNHALDRAFHDALLTKLKELEISFSPR